MVRYLTVDADWLIWVGLAVEVGALGLFAAFLFAVSKRRGT